ncbi:MAG: hypothetical protein HF978_02060 [Desulfobacteraceae bacterium]|nr:hypothetical protein [Desulfobacteraceae bacterium]MBC2754309.1 hypothetical protein [Desulfobacteraceae bacterium]
MKKAMNFFTLAFTLMLLVGFSSDIVKAKTVAVPAVNPADFNDPEDNLYLPMAFGQTYVYLAETEDELILNEITATYDTRLILGVLCTVVYDVEWIYIEEEDDWFIEEETFDWYAWDNYGNVWYFGEETVEYIYDDDWNLIETSTEGSWEAGVDGAEAGILMLADPMPGLSYKQEYYEDEAEDMGRVLTLNAGVEVEYGDFDDCLKTKEWTPLEPGEIEHKYYAPGIGLVFIEELKGKTVLVELVDIR